MDNKKHYHVIILGAGIAGLSLSLYLNKLGIKDVIVIDRYNEKYHKACSGILTDKSIKLLKEIDISPEGYKKWNGVNAFYNGNFNRKYPNDVYAYQHIGLNRVSLDSELKDQCKKVGINVKENVTVWDMYFRKRRFNDLTYDYLVDATGFSSVANTTNKKLIGIEAKIIDKSINEKDIVPNVYLSSKLKGYAWIVKSINTTTIGFTTFYKKSIDPKIMLKDFAEENNISLNDDVDIRAAFIPCKASKRLINGRVAYIGERAELNDSLTQEGIFYALDSAKKVANAISLNNLNIYKKEMKPVVASLRRAYLYRKVFFTKSFQKKLWDLANKHQFTNYVFSLYSKLDFFDYRKIRKYHNDYKMLKNK